MCASVAVEPAPTVSSGFPDHAARACQVSPLDVDLSATHSFSFAQQSWLHGVDACIRATLALLPGVFLLVEAFMTPKLKLQIGIAGAALTIVGIAAAKEALPHFLGKVTVDRRGVSLRKIVRTATISWEDLAAWSLIESDSHGHGPAEFSMHLQSTSGKRLLIPAGSLSPRYLPKIRFLMELLASDRGSVT